MVNKYDDDGLMVMMTTTLELCYCVILHSKRYGMVICLERGADLHMSQLMPLPLTVSCFNKIQIGFTFLVPLRDSFEFIGAI